MPVICFQCNKLFSCQSSLNRHLKIIHNETKVKPISYEFNVHNSKCYQCLSSFKKVGDLRDHLSSIHNFQNETEELTFDNFQGFETWLSSISTEQNIQYVRVRSKKRPKKENLTFYYNCSRSLIASRKHFHIPKKQDRQRVEKSQGCSKMQNLCTSQIKVVQKDKKVNVVYYKTHYQHKCEIQHLRVSKEERNNIACKLMSGVSVTSVLDQNRDDFTEDHIKRRHILTRKDITNIKTSFGIVSDEGIRNKNDAISVELFVEEQKACINNYVLYYKPQGSEDDLLKNEDFCLILMNRSQLLMLKKIGSNIISIDSTHGLNSYDFELTTLMVVDEYGEGFPVALMFSNRKDTLINEVLFSKIKIELDDTISTKTFMSDITHVFINAWKTVMGEPENQLYCAWHIDKAWQINLMKVQDLEKRKWVYQTVKYLQNYDNEKDFQEILKNAINTFCGDEDTTAWGNYFQKNYGNNYKLWASCFRKGCGINTNMHLESMHRTIKHCYLHGKTVARLDKGLHAVVKLVRDKIVDRIMKKTKGKNNCHIRDIHKKHKTALKLDLNVEVVEDNLIFRVKSENTLQIYEVTKLSEHTCCPLQCKFCKICVHSFSCTCHDFYLKNTICKHIHFILTKNLVQIVPSIQEQNKQKSKDYSLEMSTHIETLNTQENENKSLVIEKINSKLIEIGQNVDTNINENALNECLQYLNKARLILKVGPKVNTTQLPNKNALPANKHIERQSLFSTKKKNQKRTY